MQSFSTPFAIYAANHSSGSGGVRAPSSVFLDVATLLSEVGVGKIRVAELDGDLSHNSQLVGSFPLFTHRRTEEL